MTRFNMFTDEELDAMESAFCNEGLTFLVEEIRRERRYRRCDNCIHSEEQDGSNCYECVKGMADNFEAQPIDADCISRTELLARIDAERKHLLNIKMDGAEHIIVHHARRIIEDMPSVTPKPYKEDIE